MPVMAANAKPNRTSSAVASAAPASCARFAISDTNDGGWRRQHEGRDVEQADRELPDDDDSRPAERALAPNRQPLPERAAGARTASMASARRSCGASADGSRSEDCAAAVRAVLNAGSAKLSSVRGCGSAIGSVSMMRAGPVPITCTSRDRNTASSIEWVTSTMVLPVRSQISSRQSAHFLAGDSVECAERLVHEQNLRVERERAGDRHALAHAARELRGHLSLRAFQADELEHRRRPRESIALY